MLINKLVGLRVMNIHKEHNVLMEKMIFNLNRFIDAQNDVYENVIQELKNGYKETHWMWFIFPQLKGLGKSETADFYGIENINEAIAYTKNNILWNRYLECCNILLNLENLTIYEILGVIDSIKLCSSLTLFYEVLKEPVLDKLLKKFFNGDKCKLTLNMLNKKV